MNELLSTLSDCIRSIVEDYIDKNTPLSFVIMTGKTGQGKTALLAQSGISRYETGSLSGLNLCWNEHGIVLELGESWLNQTSLLLAAVLKRLNRCHPRIKVTGFLLCIDSYELMCAEPSEMIEHVKLHCSWIERFGEALGIPVDTAILLTKLDTLQGFNEFFHDETPESLKKSLGFSLEPFKETQKRLQSAKIRFDQMMETLGQQIIPKLHHERTKNRRTLIREFPLQLAAGLRIPVQALVSYFPVHRCTLRAIYFTSAEQGGSSIDWINKKIRQDYGVGLIESLPQSKNYRSCFIAEPLQKFLERTPYQVIETTKRHKKIAWGLGFFTFMSLVWISKTYLETAHLIDKTAKHLAQYEIFSSQKNAEIQALYHLLLSEENIRSIPTSFLMPLSVKKIMGKMEKNTEDKLQNMFLPKLLNHLEAMMLNPAISPIQRYEALKHYLMLSDSSHFSKTDWMEWFLREMPENAENRDKTVLLLKRFLAFMPKEIALNQRVILDTRNFLNALPKDYFYWSFAKSHFPRETVLLSTPGFVPSEWKIPIYFTADYYPKISLILSSIVEKIEDENWVLSRQDAGHIKKQLQRKYEEDYVAFWQQLIKKVRPESVANLKETRELLKKLSTKNTVGNLLLFVQKETEPRESKGYHDFNKNIASHFTKLNLLNDSSINGLNFSFKELDNYLRTLLLLENQREAIFEITKNRFEKENSNDPLSKLYQHVEGLPYPVSEWGRYVANDIWYFFVIETRLYLNELWSKKIYSYYVKEIANRYPFELSETKEVLLEHFDRFFAPKGLFNTFVNAELKPFLDTSHPEWQAKERDGYKMPISDELMNELIRANVISNMFFQKGDLNTKVSFSLQKISLDPVISNLEFSLGNKVLSDTQDSDSNMTFIWPNPNAKLTLKSIDGQRFELSEKGEWAFFKILQKINVLVDDNDSSNLQILFEINGNSGRYLLRTDNTINPFSPGVLTGFNLKESIA